MRPSRDRVGGIAGFDSLPVACFCCADGVVLAAVFPALKDWSVKL